MTERSEILIVVVRQMHARLASIDDIEEIVEETMTALNFTDAEKALVRKEVR